MPTLTDYTLARLGDQTAADTHFNPGQLRDPHTGEWVDMPGGGNGLDKLKLASRIDLKPGETLVSSRKIRTSHDDSWDLLAAEIDTPAGRQVRLGVVFPDDSKHWAAGPDPKRQQHLAQLDAQIEALEAKDEAQFTDADSDRLEALQDEYNRLQDTGNEVNQTITLAPTAAGDLRNKIDPAAQLAREWAAKWDKFMTAHQAESDEIDVLWRQRNHWTPEQKARFDEINAVFDQMGEPDPTFAEGVLEGADGKALGYRVQGSDDGTWSVEFSIRTQDKVDEYGDSWFGAYDDKAIFEPKNIAGLLKELSDLSGANQTAAMHEFCRQPLHPGPCRGWKGAKAAGLDHTITHEQHIPQPKPRRRAKPKPAPVVSAEVSAPDGAGVQHQPLPLPETPAAPDGVLRARERQANIDAARSQADLLAELEEVAVLNEASPDVIVNRAEQTARRLGLADSPELAPVLEAARSGDPDRIQAAIDTAAAGLGLQKLSEGRMVPYDRAKHKNLGSGGRQGQMMWVVRPGYTATLPDGEKVQLEKTVVEEATPQEVMTERARIAPSAIVDKAPRTTTGVPTYTPPATLSPEEIKRATTLVRRDPQIFATAHERLGNVSTSGMLSSEDAAWLQSVTEREPAFINHLAQTAQIDRLLRRDAKKAGETPAKFKAKAAAQLKAAVAGKPVAVRVRDEAALRNILSSGRFKTSFDRDTKRAPGLTVNLDKRRLAEETNGVPADTPAARRPVYGYVALNGIEPALFEGRKTPGIREVEGQQDVLSSYGKVQVVLNPEVRHRTTVTLGDSLDEIGFMQPSPIDDPKAESLGYRGAETLAEPGFTRRGYVEAQIHDGVSRDDIAGVIFPSDPSPDTAQALESAGIPWRVMGPTSQTAAVLVDEVNFDRSRMHEFCRNPLHPGPCKGWKGVKGVEANVPAQPPPEPAGKVTGQAKQPPTRKARIPAPKTVTRAQAKELQASMLAGSPWDEPQKEALSQYTGTEYLVMNSQLRGVTPRAFGQVITDPDPDLTRARIHDANAALRPLPQPVRVFRNAVTSDGFGLPKVHSQRELLEQLRALVGQRRQERGFSSTATTRPKSTKFGDVRLDIEVPAGTRGAFVDDISASKREGELTLEPGLHYEFISLDESGDLPTVKVRVTGP